MKQRVFYLIRIFAAFLLFFIMQKVLFTIANAGSSAEPVTAGDVCQVVLHGLGLDVSTTGYLSIIPFLMVWASIWIRIRNVRAWLRPYFIVVATLLSVICVVDTSLYDFWQFKLDATVLNYMDAPRQAMASVSAGFIIGRILLIAAFATLLAWACIKLTPKALPEPVRKWRLLTDNLIQVLVGGLIFLGIRGGVGRSTMNIGNAYFSPNTYLNHAAVNPAFNLLYSWTKAEAFDKKYDWMDEEQRAAVYDALYPAETEDCTRHLLNTDRPQVLIIVMEGFGGDYVKELGGAPDVAPNLSRLIKEGVFFDNVWANSFRTDRGLVSALSGHLSYPTNSIMKLPAKAQSLPCIAQSLAAAGYATDFLYGGDIDFTNMRSYFTNTGYKTLTADKDFSLAERTSSSWGAHDEYTFNRLFEMIKERPLDELWHTGFLTLSSHEPFEVPYSRLEDKRLNSFAYTDHCLGAFIDRLKTLPVWDNLLVVCLPDHGSSVIHPVTNPVFYHIPLLWLGGAVKEPAVIHTLMNQSDMPATLLSQLGIAHRDFEFSRNIFSEHYTYPFAYSTFSDGFMFRDSTGVTLYDNAARRRVVDEPADGDTRELRGKAILQTSYDKLAEK